MPSRPKRVRYRCPACFCELLSMPHPEGEGPLCGCKLPRWHVMELVPRVRRTRRQARIDLLAEGFAKKDHLGRSDYFGRATRPVGE